MPAAASLLDLAYLTPAALDALRETHAARVLGVIAFGAEAPSLAAPDFPYAWVDMPVLGAGPVLETWSSAEPVVRDDSGGIASARNAEILFGCIQIDRADLEAATYDAYAGIFDFVDGRGYPHLLRAWNYFPAINTVADGLERYQGFCRGRHEAFAAKGRVIGQDTPAASALGCRSGPLTVYFVAARNAGQRVENPRQTSAYHYPPQYGPRSPTFSRGMLMRDPAGARLFISGTAGIVGHETQHRDSPDAQARETMENIRAVLAEAGVGGAAHSATWVAARARFSMKAYVRHPDYVAAVQSAVHAAFGEPAEVVYLQADICRADLLLEVEAVYHACAAGQP